MPTILGVPSIADHTGRTVHTVRTVRTVRSNYVPYLQSKNLFF